MDLLRTIDERAFIVDKQSIATYQQENGVGLENQWVSLIFFLRSILYRSFA